MIYMLFFCVFTEAREHGVGYYEFSTDHEERERQQKEMRKIHEVTVEAQEERNKLKSARDAILANRIKAAKQRVRQRLGLPDNEDDEDDGSKKGESSHLNFDQMFLFITPSNPSICPILISR